MLRSSSRVSLRAIVAFESIARLGSLRRASEELGITVSAVSRLLSGLEDQLQNKLLDRSGRLVQLTITGRLLADQISRPISEIERAIDLLAPEVEVRRVQICANPTLAVRWLVPRLGHFHANNTGISVEVLTTPDIIDPRSHSADGVIWCTERVDPPLIGELLFEEQLVVVGASQLLESQERRPLADILQEVPLFAVHRRIEQWRRWYEVNGLDPDTFKAGHVYGSTNLIIPALLGGQGLGIVDMRFVHTELTTGILKRIPVSPFRSGLAYWLIYDGAHTRRRPFVRFAEWLKNSQLDDVGGFEDSQV